MRRLLIAGLGLALICVLFIAFLPTIANTHWGRKQVIKFINQSIPGRLDIRSMHLQWGKRQTLEGVRLTDPEGHSVLEIEQVSTQGTLWQLWFHSMRLGHTQIKDLNAAIVTNPQGETNFQRALGWQESLPSLNFLPSTIILSDVNADFYFFTSDHPFSLEIQGKTKQDQLVGSFNTQVVLDGLQATTWEDFSKNVQKYLSLEGSHQATVHAQVTRFPVDLIDRLIALKYPALNGLFHSLLGDQLNLNIGKENSSQGLAFHLDAKAPLMQGNIKGKIVEESIVLQEPATLLFHLEPEFINPFIPEKFTLEQKTQLKATFQELTLPLAFFSERNKLSDPCQIGLKGLLALDSTIVDVQSVGKIKLMNLQALLNAPLCEKTMDIHFTGEAQQNKEPFQIQFQSTFAKPLHFSQGIQQWRQTMDSSLKISQFPLKLLLSSHEYTDLLQEIGPTLALQLSAKSIPSDEWLLALSMQTDQITLNKAQFKVGKDIVLTNPTPIQWIISPSLIQTFLKDNRWTFDQKNSLQLMVKELNVPLHDLSLIKLKMDGSLSNLQLSQLLPQYKLQIQDIHLAAEGQNKKEFLTELKAKINILDAQNLYSAFFPRPLELTQQATWKWDKKENLTVPDVQLAVDSPTNSLKMKGQFSPQKKQFVFNQPVEANYLLTQEGEQQLAHLLDIPSLNLNQAIPFQLTVNPTTLDWQQSFYQSLKANGKLTAKQITFQNSQISSDLLPILKNLVIAWDMQGAQNLIQADLTGSATTKAASQSSQLHAQFKVNRWLQQDRIDLSHAHLDLQAQLNQLPSSLFNIALGTDRWTPLWGPSVNLKLKSVVDKENQIPGFLEMQIESPTLFAEGHLTIDQAIRLSNPQKPLNFHLTVTPENYQKLFQQSSSSLTLMAPVKFSGELSHIYFPLTAELEKTNPGQLKMTVNSSEMHWRELPEVLHLQALLSSERLVDEMHLDMKLHSSKAAQFNLQATVAKWLTPQKSMNEWQQMHVQSQANMQEFSPTLLRALLFLDKENEQKIQAVLGDAIQAHLSSDMNQLSGPLALDIKGSNGWMQLKGNLKQGILTLREPLKGEVHVTPLLGPALFSKSVPVLESLLDAENPIRLSIEPENFSAPLIPFVLDQMQIGKGSLDFGKMRFRNEGEFYSALKLIHPVPDQQINIWFTPIYFHLKQGLFSVQRVDLLVAHAYWLASWGMIDLNTQQMDMTVGLSAQALQYAFGVQGLNKNYMLLVPLRSRQGKIEVDQKRTAAQISSLLAQTHGGKTGQILGSLLDTVMNDSGEAHPKPTTTPFPWENEFNSAPQSSHSALEKEQKEEEDEEDGIDHSNDSHKKEKKKHKKRDQALEILNQFLR